MESALALALAIVKSSMDKKVSNEMGTGVVQRFFLGSKGIWVIPTLSQEAS